MLYCEIETIDVQMLMNRSNHNTCYNVPEPDLAPVPLRLFGNVMTLHWHNMNVNKMSTFLKLRPTNTRDIVMTFSLGNRCIQTFHWMRLFSHTLLL